MSDWQPPPPGAGPRLPPLEEQNGTTQQGPASPPGGRDPASPERGRPEPGHAASSGDRPPGSAEPKRGATLLIAGLAVGGVFFLVAGAIVVWKLFGAGDAPQQQVAAAPTGTLVVASAPPGATVRLDEKVLGTTPLTEDVAPGAYELRVVREGHEPFAQPIELAAGETKTFTAQLEKRMLVESDETGRLTLETKPGAKVYVNGELLGETPLDDVEVPAGVVPLELELPHGERVTRAVFVKPNDITKTFIDLTRGP